jgi:hypothetical protein
VTTDVSVARAPFNYIIYQLLSCFRRNKVEGARPGAIAFRGARSRPEALLQEQFGFILHHRVMERQTDDELAVPMVEDAQARFPRLRQVSFDKGFHTPANQKALSELLDRPVLPRKGKLSQAARAIEQAEAFQQARRAHSAVESDINALEVHGLDRCPDHGLKGFKRYVALAVVARNIQILGATLRKQERPPKTGQPDRLAA